MVILGWKLPVWMHFITPNDQCQRKSHLYYQSKRSDAKKMSLPIYGLDNKYIYIILSKINHNFKNIIYANITKWWFIIVKLIISMKLVMLAINYLETKFDQWKIMRQSL